MQKFTAHNLAEMFAAWGQFQQVASTDDPQRPLPESARDVLSAPLLACAQLCRELELERSGEAVVRLMKELAEECQCGEILWKMEELRKLIESEMKDCVYFAVPKPLAQYAGQERPMGDDVYNAFPSARRDLTEAGNCLAYGCNPAAAFHLMRAAEIGLWELGRDRQIPLATSGKIEFTEWGIIISELENAVKAIQQWPNSKTKEDAHKFYNTALVEIRAFNDGWRRHNAHVRPYQPQMGDDEALALWGHVSRFLSTLASKIAEGRYTTLVW